MEKIEEILSEAFQCRSLAEVERNASVQTYQDRPGVEHYFYGDTLVLEVKFVQGGIAESPRWEFRTPNLSAQATAGRSAH